MNRLTAFVTALVLIGVPTEASAKMAARCNACHDLRPEKR